MTKGEYKVGISFNPSSNPDVDAIKKASAALIDLVDNLPKSEDTETASEQGRLKALAMTSIEEAAMWAVKAATKQPKEA